MAMKTLARQLVAQAYMEEETTAGTFIAAGTFDYIGAVQIDLSVSQQQASLQEVALPGASSMMNHSAEYSGTIRVPFIMGNSDQLLAASFRNSAMQAEASMASATIDGQTSQTHLDGTTGSRLKGTGTDFFNSLITGGVFSDLDEAVIYCSGFSGGAANLNYATRGPIIAKPGSPYNATDSFIDIDQRCETETGGSYFGAIPSFSSLAGDLDAGAWLRPRLTTNSGTGSYSIAFNTQGLTTDYYFALAGVHFGGPTFQINGRGFLEISLPFVATGYTSLTTSDPVSGSRADNTAFDSPFEMSTGLTQAWLMDDSNAWDLTGGGVVFSTLSIESQPSLVQDSMGNDAPDGVDFPPYTANLAFQYHVRDETLAADIQGLANADDATTSAFFEWTNRAGEWMTLYFPQMSVGKSIVSGIGVGGGPITGEFAAQGHLKHRDGSLATLSKFT